MTIFGTRPEAVKMAPLVQALKETDHLQPVVVVSAQHREMLDGVLNTFNIKPDFDLDIMPRRTDEVLVDVGAYIGDSCIDYIESYGKESYKKIYCYEISDENIEKMRGNLRNYENICILKKAVSDFNGELHFDNNADSSANKTAEKGSETVNAVTLDDDLTETISVVKMDIEGGEISALKGMKNHIKKDRPTLLISVYHNNTDLLDIPKLIADYNKDYQYYLRYYGGCYFATEIVLIAIPAKREER